MSHEYAEKRIKEALQKAKGNATQAKQDILTACSQDHALLLAIARAHLSGIVAYAVDRVISKSVAGEGDMPEPIPEIDQGTTDFGMELMRESRGHNAAHFGQENVGPRAKTVKASKSHIDAINQIAKKKSGDNQ